MLSRDDWRGSLTRAAAAHDLGGRVLALAQFVELFARWNQRINLSAAKTPLEIAGHVVDSLAVVPHLREAASVVDVGTGGGFPALIAAIALPDLAIRCVEPVNKKTAFLSTAVRELRLTRVEVVTRRVDEAMDHGFDVSMSRATFDLAEWLALGARLVRPGGKVLGMEGLEQVALGPDDTRHAYDAGDRQRAIIVRRVPG